MKTKHFGRTNPGSEVYHIYYTGDAYLPTHYTLCGQYARLAHVKADKHKRLCKVCKERERREKRAARVSS